MLARTLAAASAERGPSMKVHQGVVEFSVAYGFGEYRRFVLDHLECLSGTAQLKGVKSTALLRFLASGAAAVSFVLKKRRMPVCDFQIDSAGIRRTTADGVLATKWIDVVAIRRYSAGYLIEKKKGAMPIPYRCLDESQRATLESLFLAWLLGCELPDPGPEGRHEIMRSRGLSIRSR